jgi:hypothetical protein
MRCASTSSSAAAIAAAGGLIICLRRRFVERESALGLVLFKQRVEPTAMPLTVHGGGYMTCSNRTEAEDAQSEHDHA